MSQEDTLRPGPDSFEGSHCGRGFQGGLGAADLCLGCWTTLARSEAPDGEGWEVSGPGCRLRCPVLHKHVPCGRERK